MKNKRGVMGSIAFGSCLFGALQIALSVGISDSSDAFADTMRTAGSLTCSVEPASGRANEIVCTYRPSGGGATAKLKGDIARIGTGTALEAHRVLVWLVVGAGSIEPADLATKFVRKEPPSDSIRDKFREALIGGAAGQIALIPPSGQDQIPGNAAVTVLELNLSSLRA